MTIRAIWNGAVLAQSNRTILVEGNQYFPSDVLIREFFEVSHTTTHCSWKGDASYYHLVVAGIRNEDAAWYYTDPYQAALGIKGYVAFWKDVEISGANPNSEVILPPLR